MRLDDLTLGPARQAPGLRDNELITSREIVTRALLLHAWSSTQRDGSLVAAFVAEE
jgi:hypothetical protein